MPQARADDLSRAFAGQLIVEHDAPVDPAG